MSEILSLFTTANIIQGGGVLIALVLAWIIYKLLTNHSIHFEKTIDRNTDAWVKNAEALSKLSTTLELTHKKKKK